LIFFFASLWNKQTHVLNLFVYLLRIKSRYLHEYPVFIISENKSFYTTEKLETRSAE
jgi:hypothetical protein